MTETIVIAELSKGEINTTTNELVSAANLLGDSCIVVVPCTDSSVADNAGKISGVTPSALFQIIKHRKTKGSKVA